MRIKNKPIQTASHHSERNPWWVLGSDGANNSCAAGLRRTSLVWSAMAKIHHLSPEQGVHGFVSRDIKPALSVDPDDTIVFQTLDSGWGAIEQPENFSEPKEFSLRYRVGDSPSTNTPGELGWSAGTALPRNLMRGWELQVALRDRPR